MTNRLTLAFSVLALSLAAGCSAPAASTPAPEVPVAGCSAPFPVADPGRAVVVEGFGGPDAQLIVTKRQPIRRCAAGLAPADEAQVSVLH